MPGVLTTLFACLTSMLKTRAALQLENRFATNSAFFAVR